jgi:hypothetical protein
VGGAVGVCGALACASFGSSSETTPISPDAGLDAPASDGSTGAGIPSGPATDFATGQPAPRDIFVDSSNVYWLCEPQGGNGGSIRSAQKTKTPGTATVFADATEISTFAPPALAMAGDALSIYWAAGPEVKRKDKSGGSPSQIIWLGQDNQAGACQSLTIESGRVYVTTSGHGGLVIANDGTKLADAELPLESNLGADVRVVTVDATDIYVGRGGQILKVPKGGSSAPSPAVFATTDGTVQGIASDADTIYWIDTSRVRSLAKSNAGGTSTDLASVQDGPSAIAIDSENVYWTNAGDGRVQTVSKHGGTATTLSSGEAQPMAIAIDAAGVFWTNYADGRVRVIWR